MGEGGGKIEQKSKELSPVERGQAIDLTTLENVIVRLWRMNGLGNSLKARAKLASIVLTMKGVVVAREVAGKTPESGWSALIETGNPDWGASSEDSIWFVEASARKDTKSGDWIRLFGVLRDAAQSFANGRVDKGTKLRGIAADSRGNVSQEEWKGGVPALIIGGQYDEERNGFERVLFGEDVVKLMDNPKQLMCLLRNVSQAGNETEVDKILDELKIKIRDRGGCGVTPRVRLRVAHSNLQQPSGIEVVSEPGDPSLILDVGITLGESGEKNDTPQIADVRVLCGHTSVDGAKMMGSWQKAIWDSLNLVELQVDVNNKFRLRLLDLKGEGRAAKAKYPEAVELANALGLKADTILVDWSPTEIIAKLLIVNKGKAISFLRIASEHLTEISDADPWAMSLLAALAGAKTAVGSVWTDEGRMQGSVVGVVSPVQDGEKHPDLELVTWKDQTVARMIKKVLDATGVIFSWHNRRNFLILQDNAIKTAISGGTFIKQLFTLGKDVKEVLQEVCKTNNSLDLLIDDIGEAQRGLGSITLLAKAAGKWRKSLLWLTRVVSQDLANAVEGQDYMVSSLGGSKIGEKRFVTACADNDIGEARMGKEISWRLRMTNQLWTRVWLELVEGDGQGIWTGLAEKSAHFNDFTLIMNQIVRKNGLDINIAKGLIYTRRLTESRVAIAKMPVDARRQIEAELVKFVKEVISEPSNESLADTFRTNLIAKMQEVVKRQLRDVILGNLAFRMADLLGGMVANIENEGGNIEYRITQLANRLTQNGTTNQDEVGLLQVLLEIGRLQNQNTWI